MKWINVASNDIRYSQLYVVCNFYGIWLSNDNLINVKNLLRTNLKYFF